MAQPVRQYRDRAMGWRALLGLVCGAAAAAVGAVMLGEYEFTGTLPFSAGPVFGLVIGEVVVGVGHSRARWAGIAAGLMAFSGVAWAGWIDSSQGLQPVRVLAWVAAALAAVTALVRTTGLPGQWR